MEISDEQQKRKGKFLEAWLSDDRYKSWISQVSNDTTIFHCNACNKNFSCNASCVSRHANSAYHKKNICIFNNNDIDNKEQKPVKRKFKTNDEAVSLTVL